MPTEGTEVFAALRARLRQAVARADQCAVDATRLDGALNELLTQRGEALLALAGHLLPEFSRPAIEATFTGIRDELLAIFARKEARRRELSLEFAEVQELTRVKDAELDEVTGRLNALITRREALESQVAAILKADPEFQERSRLALQAEQLLHRDERRAAEIREEAAEKLPHYENSALFRYLHDRGFATDSYRAKGLIRSLDRWVARLIGYDEARNGYEFLRKTPELVDAEVARRRSQFTELMRQVEAGQAEAADQAGLTAVLREGDALGTQRDGLVQERDPLVKRTRAIQEELTELDRRHDRFYKEAIARFRDFLSDTRLALLEQRARQTPDPKDDAIVADVAEIDNQIEALRPRLAELANRRHATVALRDSLDRLVQRYRQAEFDSQRSYFPDSFDVHAWLRDLDVGATDVESLWGSIRRHQRFRPHWIETTTSGTVDVLSGPAGRVLMGAVLEAASQAMRDSAYRGVQRRAEIGFPEPHAAPSFPSAPSFPQPSSAPPPSQGGFTSGDGF
ncbi:MAG: hypothetical protein AB7I30_08365 [Isosphaeraceae bacterium]